MKSIKDMRDELKELELSVPRKNSDVVELYKSKFPDAEVEECEEESNVVKMPEKPKGETWTYTGYGHTPPQVINFMGLQTFMRGQATEVTHPLVLKKLGGNKSFVKGVVNAEQIITQDEVQEELYQRKIRDNQIIQSAAKRNNR